MITSGEHIAAAEALELGLIDAVVDSEEEGGLDAGAIRFALRAVAEGRGLPRVRDIESHREVLRENPTIFSDFRRRIARRTRGFNAPEVCIQCVEAAVELPFDEGLAREAELSRTLHADPQSRAQRYYFFAERAARKIPDVPADTPVREIAKVGVLGAGTMGGGISMAFANAGFPVQVVEQSREALDRGLATVRSNYERSAARGRFTAEQVEERMGLLDGGTDQDVFAECDLVIEAVFEDMNLKKRVFGQLDRVAKPGALLAHEHLLPRRQRDRRRHRPAGGRRRHALLQPGEHHEAGRGRAGREVSGRRDRHGDVDLPRHRQGAGPGRRLPRFRRQPDALPAPPAGRPAGAPRARCPGTSTGCSTTSACRWVRSA